METYTLHPILKNKAKACNIAIDIVNIDTDRLMKDESVSLYSETTGEKIGIAILHSFGKNCICIRCTSVNGCQSCVYQLKPQNLFNWFWSLILKRILFKILFYFILF